MQISLPQELMVFISQQIQNGGFKSESKLIEEALIDYSGCNKKLKTSIITH